jgi:hypothetical protein
MTTFFILHSSFFIIHLPALLRKAMAGGPARNATQSVAGGFFILHKMGYYNPERSRRIGLFNNLFRGSLA